MSGRTATLVASAVLAFGLSLVGAQLQVPYVGLGPGPVFDTLGTVDPDRAGADPIISITGTTTYPADGHLDLTTVSVYGSVERRIKLVQALEFWLDRDYAVVPAEILYPEDKSREDLEREVAEEMQQSQQTAVTAALRELKVPVTTTVVVKSVQAGGPSATVLRDDDVITSVDGTPVKDAAGLRATLRSHQPGDVVRIGYLRSGTTATAAVRTGTSDDGEGRAIIGVELTEESEYPFTVSLRTDDVGGPSAGLMFALGIIEQLTPGSMTDGVHVAGTGTITDDGEVGPIGGIQQKLIAAADAGATHFLVPAGNFADAEDSAPDGLELHRVSTLKEALAALTRIRAAA